MELLIQQLEGAFACAFKSRMFPGEIVCTRRGSPLLVGIKTENDDLATDSIPIQYRYVGERVCQRVVLGIGGIHPTHGSPVTGETVSPVFHRLLPVVFYNFVNRIGDMV